MGFIGIKKWNELNDGNGSGLDADTIDTHDTAYFAKKLGDSANGFSVKSPAISAEAVPLAYLNTRLSSVDAAKLGGELPAHYENVQADWNEATTTSDTYINNKPALAPSNAEQNVQADWNEASNLSDAYILNKPALAPSNAEQNVQADWNEATTTSDAYILNKPALGNLDQWTGITDSGGTDGKYYRLIKIFGTQNAQFRVNVVGNPGYNGTFTNGEATIYLELRNGGDTTGINNCANNMKVFNPASGIDFGLVKIGDYEYDLYIKAGSWHGVVCDVSYSSNGTVVEYTDDYNSTTRPSGYTKIKDVSTSVYSNTITNTAVAGNGALDQFNIATISTSTNFGNLTQSRSLPAAVSNGSRGVFGGGEVGSSTIVNTIDYITISTPGSAIDFGNLTHVRYMLAAVSNDSRGVFGGGHDSGNNTGIIDYITISTTGNATNFGNLTNWRSGLAATSDNSRGVFGNGSTYNILDYITISTTGNATNFGQLTNSRYMLSATSDNSRGVFGGGGYSVTIDYITISTTSNATNFGNLTVARQDLAATSNLSRGVFMGGRDDSGNIVDTIDYITISTTGNATNFGNLTSTNWMLAAVAGN